MELDVAVLTGKEVVEEEMDFTEGSEGFGMEDVAKPDEHVWQDASANCRGKCKVCCIGSHQEYGHYHVHRHDGIHHDVRYGKFSALFVNAEKVGKLVVSVRNHVHQEVRRGSKGESKDRISDRATDCSANGRVGCERHNGGMIAQHEILGQVSGYLLANVREEYVYKFKTTPMAWDRFGGCWWARTTDLCRVRTAL